MRDINGISYCNDGDWVESRTALVENYDGSLELLHWAPALESRLVEPVRTMGVNENVGLVKKGPRNWLCQAAGAAAPSGLETAAPNLLEQVWTGDRSEASGERRLARCRALHEVSNRGGNVAP